MRGDLALVQGVADGDTSALAELYDRWAGVVLAIARRILRSGEAEDLVHDVFLEVWRHAAEYDPARGSVRAWLVTRTRSRALDRVKSPAVTRAVPLRGCHDRPAPGTPEDRADGGRVRAAMQALDPEHREVLELRYWEGLSSSEIAARVRLPVGTVKSRVATALARLRQDLRVAV
jgi:RNA polymerase sigma-70 factor (ECF subfamily)